MSLRGIVTALARAHALDSALSQADRSADFSLVDGLRAPLIAALLERRTRVLLVIPPTSREGDAFRRSLEAYLPDASIVEFPAWETLPHERLSPSAETVGHRLAAIRRDQPLGLEAAPLVVVASVRAALQPLADNLADLVPLELDGRRARIRPRAS